MSQRIRCSFIAFIRATRLSVGVALMAAFAVGMSAPAAQAKSDLEIFKEIFGLGKGGDWFWIVSSQKAQCLGTVGGKTGIFLQGCDKSNHHQQWQKIHRTGTRVFIRGRARSKCMDVDGTIATWKDDLRPIEVEPCKSSVDPTNGDQTFIIGATVHGPHSRKYQPIKLMIEHSRKCAGLTLYSAYRLDQRTCSGDVWQSFFITPVGN